MNNAIYFDHAATTSVDPQVLTSFLELSTNVYANPHSAHALGYQALALLNQAREQILQLFATPKHRVIFTSGATEANNLALKGVALAYQNRGKHIITSQGEHPSVLEPLKQLHELFGFEITYLPLNEQGTINLADLSNAMRSDTIIVSLMCINNETGAINDLAAIAKIVKAFPKCFLHSDVTQAATKIPLNYQEIDLFTFSAHKIHGIKGSGALILRKEITPIALNSGGGQEDGLRSGTVALPLDITLAKTLRQAFTSRENDYLHLKKLHDYLYQKLQKVLQITLNSSFESSPHIINFSLNTHRASVIVEALSNDNIFVASHSACSDKKLLPSHVIMAMFNNRTRAENTIRLSLDVSNTFVEADRFLQRLDYHLTHIKE